MASGPPPVVVVDGCRACSRCGEVKPLEEFHASRHSATGRTSDCAVCRRRIQHEKKRWLNGRNLEVRRRWYHEGGGREIERAIQRKKTYGLDADGFAVLVEAQGGVCAACGDSPPEGRVLTVDHDHTDGHIRGLLCQRATRASACSATT